MIRDIAYTDRANTLPGEHVVLPDWRSKDDADIWDEFKKGNRDALIYIYKAYFPELFNYGFQFNKDRDLIKDLIQDLFIYLYKKRDSIKTTTSIKFYLFKCLRRRIKVQIDQKERFDNVLNVPSFTIEQSPESIYIADEERIINRHEIGKTINKLPLRQREIIYYYYYENFSYKEIASILGVKQIKSARKLLYRAIDSLKKGMGGLSHS